jgi:hypothetical protein
MVEFPRGNSGECATCRPISTMPERRILELDFLPTDGRGCQSMGDGKLGALPFFLAPKSSKPLDH